MNDNSFKPNDEVFLYHGRELAKAKCVKAELRNGDFKLLVHYLGWKRKWDEWISPSVVLKNTEENRLLYEFLKNNNEKKEPKEVVTQPKPIKKTAFDKKKKKIVANKNIDVGDNLFDILVKDSVIVNYYKNIIKLPQTDLPTIHDLFNDYLISRFELEDQNNSVFIELNKLKRLNEMTFKEDQFNANLKGSLLSMGINFRKSLFLELVCGLKKLFNFRAKKLVYFYEEPQVMQILDKKFSEKDYSKIYLPKKIDHSNIESKQNEYEDEKYKEKLQNIRNLMCQYNDYMKMEGEIDLCKVFLPINIARMFIDSTVYHLLDYFEYNNIYGVKLLRAMLEDFITFMDFNREKYFKHVNNENYYNLEANEDYFKNLPNDNDNYAEITKKCLINVHKFNMFLANKLNNDNDNSNQCHY